MDPDDEEPPSEPVLPPGHEVPARELVGCAIAYVLMFIAIVGLPIVIIYGLVSGDWRLVVPWAIIALIVFVLGRLNKIPIFE